MTKLFRRYYPRHSRAIEAVFFLLFLIVMLPVSPLLLIWLAGEQAGKFIEWYGAVWEPFNRLHNKLNPYKD
ncbi:TPA: DUF4014 family protein [Enterobacter chengduensis]|uniref:DUF4014 family protein n=1 Tax=Enterobacteriaceae TaxID=543 RepID=UPI00064A7061|nr:MULTISPECIES: DUF4014 family protein [Enterobacteriaceae]EKX4008454.1 DUF4014 family protein [Enterobacter cloacae]KLQ12357.1 sugar acetyltransferase inhibitor [Enterobacter chengduensis]KZP88191.1 sugar acetyltransferase inhibitor [Enterobacter chengduensis]MCU6205131.1 DUF4014 family protein [Enterobacter cloacae]MCU6445660.1 DUF4014 family protein [Escherichia coli]